MKRNITSQSTPSLPSNLSPEDNSRSNQLPPLDGSTDVSSRADNRGSNKGPTLKTKLNRLEVQLAEQAKIIEHQQNVIERLERNENKILSSIEERMRVTSQSFEKQIQVLREELDHKFSLQLAENKRLETHASNQKAESQTLLRRQLLVEQRLEVVESEMVGEEGEDGEYQDGNERSD